VDKICNRFLNGVLPEAASENDFVEALSTIVIPEEGSPDLVGCPREAVREYFETQLHGAISMLRASQTSLVN